MTTSLPTVLTESALRFTLFEGKSPHVGEGLPGILVEVANPEAKGPRLFKSPAPLKALHEAIVDIAHWEQLSPQTWMHSVSLGETHRQAVALTCDDVANRVPPPAGATKETPAMCRIELLPVTHHGHAGAGYVYQLLPREGSPDPDLVPIALVVRVRRRLLARAAWLRVQKTLWWRSRVRERSLALDRCVNLAVYSASPSVPVRLSWTHITVTNGRRETLLRVQRLFEGWVRGGANLRVFTRVWRVGASELAKEDVSLLVALLRIGFWVILSHKHEAQPVRIQIVDAPDEKALSDALRERDPRAASAILSQGPLLGQLLEGLLRLEPLVLPKLSVSYVYTAASPADAERAS